MSLTVVATALPRPDSRQEVLQAAERAAALFHDEPGCELWAIQEDDDRLVVVEKWTDRSALDAHNSGDALRSFVREISDALTAPLEVIVLRPHPAGGPKGAL